MSYCWRSLSGHAPEASAISRANGVIRVRARGVSRGHSLSCSTFSPTAVRLRLRSTRARPKHRPFPAEHVIFLTGFPRLPMGGWRVARLWTIGSGESLRIGSSGMNTNDMAFDARYRTLSAEVSVTVPEWSFNAVRQPCRRSRWRYTRRRLNLAQPALTLPSL
jgi:hypothetical protein